MRTQDNEKKISLIGMLIAFSIVAGYLENFIPLPVPGLKLGIANIGIMISLYLLDWKSTILIAILKSLLVPLITGNFIIKLTIGLPATLAAATFMIIYKTLTNKFTTATSTGALGAFIHINCQFVLIKFLFIKSLTIYKILPYFSLFSVIAGTIIGYLTIITTEIILKTYNK